MSDERRAASRAAILLEATTALPQPRQRPRPGWADATLARRRPVPPSRFGRTRCLTAVAPGCGALYAPADRADPHHADVAELLQAERGPLIVAAVGVAEADYLILTRLGIKVELAFLEDLAEGTFQVECLARAELGTAARLARQYHDLALGLADGSLVVLAQRFRTRRLVTFDERALRSVHPLQGGTLLPADR